MVNGKIDDKIYFVTFLDITIANTCQKTFVRLSGHHWNALAKSSLISAPVAPSRYIWTQPGTRSGLPALSSRWGRGKVHYHLLLLCPCLCRHFDPPMLKRELAGLILSLDQLEKSGTWSPGHWSTVGQLSQNISGTARALQELCLHWQRYMRKSCIVLYCFYHSHFICFWFFCPWITSSVTHMS
jgi:hypothetical protein